MWLLKCKGGLELTEADLGTWDAVPINAEIEALALAIARDNAPPYVLEYKRFERYCCSRIGSSVAGLGGHVVGYSVAVEKGGLVIEQDIFPAGMRLTAVSVYWSQIPERCWRRGTT
jgi:hypothetical protein